MTIKVTAPNSSYTGKVGDDAFVDGVCESASTSHLAYYRQQGFVVEEISDAAPAPQDQQDDELQAVRPASDALKEEWADYAQRVHGIDTEDMTKAQITAAIEAAEDQS